MKKKILKVAGYSVACFVLALGLLSVTSTTAQPSDCFTYCEQNANWDCEIEYSDGSYVYCHYFYSEEAGGE